MNKKLLSPILFIAFIIPFLIFGQTSEAILDQAQKRAYSGDFAGADELLTSIIPQDKNYKVLAFHAQVLYWMEDFKRAENVHKEIQRLFPAIDEAKLEYGRFLYNLGQINEAEILLQEYLHKAPDHAEANLMLANIEAWNGRLGKAKERAKRMAANYPENPAFKTLMEDLSELTAPVLTASGTAYSDDQPLEYLGLGIQASWYRSWLISPQIKFSGRKFNPFESDLKTAFFLGENDIYFKSKTRIKFGGGIFLPSAKEEKLFAMSFGLNQELFKSVSANLSYEKMPYQYTRSSILHPFLASTYKGSVNLETSKGIYGEVGHQQQVFPDDNKVKASFIWALAPVLNGENLKLSTGYSYNFSTSDHSTFTTEASSGGERPFPPTGNRPVTQPESGGYYYLYFTPKNQQVHSLLASLRLGAGKINFTGKINAGLFATADAPYQETVSTIAFENISYSPLEIETALNFSLSRSLSLSGKYNYQSLFFFEAHTGSFELTHTFFQ